MADILLKYRRKKFLTGVVFPTITKLNRVIFHPISVFVILQIVCATITVLWVIWYVNQNSIIFAANYDLAFLITGCILCGIIIIGTVLLFVSTIKQKLLYRQQRSFVSSVTHELRSPIASMQLSLETLQTQQLEAELKEKVFDMMHADMDRLVGLVDQILISARLDKGIKLFESAEQFDIYRCIEEAISQVTHLDSNIAKRVTINCVKNTSILCSKPAISLILNNLVENAVKYSPANSPILISAYTENGDLRLDINDRGFGLTKQEKKQVFKIFNRGNITTKKAISGTGLGLYIVRSICKVLDGKVWAESPGKNLGSTFHIYLPGVSNQ